MNYYLMASGIALNAFIAIAAVYFLWVSFIWPLAEAISITRCLLKASRMYGGEPTIKNTLKEFAGWYSDFLFGRSCTRISNRQFEWEGVGKWNVYADEEK